ncbi:MAG: hypothetical protein NTW48_05750, partial [Chloroflexi bacterium]|nr:hypothetical protein [Chloroflexota bacterium]
MAIELPSLSPCHPDPERSEGEGSQSFTQILGYEILRSLRSLRMTAFCMFCSLEFVILNLFMAFSLLVIASEAKQSHLTL